MCLYADIKETAAFKKKYKNCHQIKVWKVVVAGDKNEDRQFTVDWQIRSWHFRSFWKAGWKTSGARKPKSLKPRYGSYKKEINKGIHVFLTRKRMKQSNYTHDATRDCYILPLTVDIRDLIAVDNKGSGVFTKAHLAESTHKRIMKQILKDKGPSI